MIHCHIIMWRVLLMATPSEYIISNAFILCIGIFSACKCNVSGRYVYMRLLFEYTV